MTTTAYGDRLSSALAALHAKNDAKTDYVGDATTGAALPRLRAAVRTAPSATRHTAKRLTSMRQPAERTSVPSPVPSGPDYPWGLRVNLDEHGHKKLGVKGTMQPGATVHLRAKATVKHASHSMDTQGSNRSAELQITHMSMEPDADEAGGASDNDYDEIPRRG